MVAVSWRFGTNVLACFGPVCWHPHVHFAVWVSERGNDDQKKTNVFICAPRANSRGANVQLAKPGNNMFPDPRHVPPENELFLTRSWRITWIISFHSNFFLRFTTVDRRTRSWNTAPVPGAVTTESYFRWVPWQLSASRRGDVIFCFECDHCRLYFHALNVVASGRFRSSHQLDLYVETSGQRGDVASHRTGTSSSPVP